MSKTEFQLDQIRKNLLNAINAAMEVHEDLIPHHDKYEPYLEDMVPSTDGFTVDRQKFRDFHNVLYFALAGTFGVDGSDGKSQPNVYFHLTDRARYPSPFIVDIPYTHDIPDDDEKAWAEVMRLAALKARAAQDEFSRISDIVGRQLCHRAAVRARIRRSKGCPDCKKGLVKAEWKVCHEFKKTCTKFQRRHMCDEPYLPMGRILCGTCQTEERESEVIQEQ
jgi:hypothetical protein